MTDNENVESGQSPKEQPEQENQGQFEEVLTEAKADESTSKEATIDESLPQDAINMVTMTHLLGLIGFVGPLVVWLLKKDEHKFINEQVKNILNYQISLMIYLLAGFLLCVILIGAVIIPVLMLMHVIFVIIASVKSSEGKAYHYPIAIRFLK
ncbi:MAG: DUF4870 domain-containing protein [Planctomycetes bacterium]|nr:DUF4870 domain-containing protein [Planctomycetota bacterium]